MGADLYAPGFEKRRAAWEAQHEAEWKTLLKEDPRSPETQARISALWDALYNAENYFRDSYNDSSVMWRLGISWWEDVCPRLWEPDPEREDEAEPECNASPALCTELADRIAAADLRPIEPHELAKFTDDPKDTVESVNAYFADKRERLVRFLRTCANEGGCSMSL